MKISAVKPLVVGTPWRNLTFVIVETDEGLRGLDEVRKVNHTESFTGAPWLLVWERMHLQTSHPELWDRCMYL